MTVTDRGAQLFQCLPFFLLAQLLKDRLDPFADFRQGDVFVVTINVTDDMLPVPGMIPDVTVDLLITQHDHRKLGTPVLFFDHLIDEAQVIVDVLLIIRFGVEVVPTRK